jgi:dihydrofolate reductase
MRPRFLAIRPLVVSISSEVARVEHERPNHADDGPQRGHGRRSFEMSKVVVFTSVTLDGVTQAPGRHDEDLRDGFELGGWAVPYADEVLGKFAAKGMGSGGAILLGRRTYEDFFGFWPSQTDNPFTEVLNETQKYVASTTLDEPLAWSNSTLLEGDAADAVATLKEQSDTDLVVLGSGELVRSLMRRGLVDRYVLLIHPVVLGSGRRLFPDKGVFAALRLVDNVTTTTGVMIATYEPAESAAGTVA